MKHCRLRVELRQKDNEIQMQQMEISNLQAALDEMQEAPAPKAEVKKFDKPADKTLTENYKKAQEELEYLRPQVETLEKYKDQVNELCAINAELLKRMKEVEKEADKKVISLTSNHQVN